MKGRAEQADMSDEGKQGEAMPLDAVPEALHLAMSESATHLHEVRTAHLHHLVTAGMLPETHLASVEPERRLAWVMEELHGRMDVDGLTLPMAGVLPEQVHADVVEAEHGSILTLRIEQDNAPALERRLPLLAQAETVHHAFVDGHLVVRW
jgi:hypothetical protein